MRKGTRHSEKAIEKMRVAKLGKKASLKTRQKLSLARMGNTICIGRTPWNKGGTSWSKGKHLSKQHRLNIGLANKGKKLSEEHLKKISGANASNWKGGTTPVNKRLRRSKEFIAWRKSVFERDNYTCQECKKRGGVLHPHHIKSFAHYPELRFELTNGRTLCKDCHMKTGTWGSKLNKNKPCLIFL